MSPPTSFGHLAALIDVPLIRRLTWHARRIASGLDRRFFFALGVGILVCVAIAALAITLLDGPWTVEKFGDAFNWSIATVFGQGDAGFVKSPGGFIVNWFLILFGVAMLGTITGALVALVIDFLLKEGQGMGASGYRDHIVVCGWNSTARDLIAELKGDDYHRKLVIVHDVDRNPAGAGTYFVHGDPSDVAELERAGIREAAAAVVCPTDDSNEADMRDILVVMAIKSIAPGVRTVAEVNNPRHAVHMREAHADEVLVTSVLASHLLARSALYPGLTDLVTDIVSGGAGSELYRVRIPDEFAGMTVDEASARLRTDHRATLLAVGHEGKTVTNPPADFCLSIGDDALVVAESLGRLAPLRIETGQPGPEVEAAPPSLASARAR
ncbi:MAG: potassium channel family protein [Candidatus Limnocylindrales bacterium]